MPTLRGDPLGARELGDGRGLRERGSPLDVPGRQAVVVEMTEPGKAGIERDHPQHPGVRHRLQVGVLLRHAVAPQIVRVHVGVRVGGQDAGLRGGSFCHPCQ